MTDKEKIRAEIERLKSIADYQLDNCKVDKSAWIQQAEVCKKLLSFINFMNSGVDYDKLDIMLDDALAKETKESWNERLGKEEHVSKDFEMALAEMVDKAQKCVVEPWVVAAQWKDELIGLAKSEEPVSEDLEEAANDYSIYDAKIEAFKDGAQWQKEQMMSKAIDALVHTFDNGYIRVGTQLLANNKYGLKVGDKVKVIIIKDSHE